MIVCRAATNVEERLKKSKDMTRVTVRFDCVLGSCNDILKLSLGN